MLVHRTDHSFIWVNVSSQIEKCRTVAKDKIYFLKDKSHELLHTASLQQEKLYSENRKTEIKIKIK